MTKNEKLEYKVQSRITKSQKDKLDELDVNLREIIDYYIVHNTNPILELKNRQRRLIKEIADLEKKVSEKKEELKKVKDKLGIEFDENNATLEVVTIAERIKDNCRIKYKEKCNKLNMGDFIISGDGKTILKRGIAEFGIKREKNKAEFLNDVFKYLGISDVIREKDIEDLLLQV